MSEEGKHFRCIAFCLGHRWESYPMLSNGGKPHVYKIIWLPSNEDNEGIMVRICSTKCRLRIHLILHRISVLFLWVFVSWLVQCSKCRSSNMFHCLSSSRELTALLKSSLLAMLWRELLPFSPKIPEPAPPLCVYPRNMRCGNKWLWPLPLILHQLPACLYGINEAWKKGETSSAESFDYALSEHLNMELRHDHQ